MKTRLMLMILGCCLSAPAFGAAAANAPLPEPNLTLNVWPGMPPGDTAELKADEQWKAGNLLTGTITTPTLAVYRPAKEKDMGAAILICPGGGFFQLSMADEGASVATWLNSIGVTGIVLKYRVPSRTGMPRYMAALQDAQRSMSIIRSKATEWGLDPKRIGIMGFSAGGQMAAEIETTYEKREYPAIDDTDKAEFRPDFAVLIYPGGIVAKSSAVPALTEDVQVSKATPPTFLAISDDDRNGSENAVYMYLALRKAGVSAELHVFSEGGHGYGIRPSNGPHATWPARVADWMTFKGYLKPAKAAPAPATAAAPAAK